MTAAVRGSESEGVVVKRKAGVEVKARAVMNTFRQIQAVSLLKHALPTLDSNL